jgi:hypothetical protein
MSRKPFNFDLAQMLFERALADHPNYVELWSECLRFLVRYLIKNFQEIAILNGQLLMFLFFPSRINNEINLHFPWQWWNEPLALSHGQVRYGLVRFGPLWVSLERIIFPGHPWLHYLCCCFALSQERNSQTIEAVEELSSRAIQSKFLENDIEALVTFTIGRADFHRRRLDAYSKATYYSSPQVIQSG